LIVSSLVKEELEKVIGKYKSNFDSIPELPKVPSCKGSDDY